MNRTTKTDSVHMQLFTSSGTHGSRVSRNKGVSRSKNGWTGTDRTMFPFKTGPILSRILLSIPILNYMSNHWKPVQGFSHAGFFLFSYFYPILPIQLVWIFTWRPNSIIFDRYLAVFCQTPFNAVFWLCFFCQLVLFFLSSICQVCQSLFGIYQTYLKKNSFSGAMCTQRCTTTKARNKATYFDQLQFHLLCTHQNLYGHQGQRFITLAFP